MFRPIDKSFSPTVLYTLSGQFELDELCAPARPHREPGRLSVEAGSILCRNLPPFC